MVFSCLEHSLYRSLSKYLIVIGIVYINNSIKIISLIFDGKSYSLGHDDISFNVLIVILKFTEIIYGYPIKSYLAGNKLKGMLRINIVYLDK